MIKAIRNSTPCATIRNASEGAKGTPASPVTRAPIWVSHMGKLSGEQLASAGIGARAPAI